MHRRAWPTCRRHLHQSARKSSKAPDNVQITTLPNKLRVATEATPSHFSTVGLFIDAGARYENPHNSGVSHFLDRMAFKSTSNRTNDEMTSEIASIGGQIMCTSSREAIMYQSSHAHRSNSAALSLIADTVLNPAFTAEELDAQRDAAFYETRELTSKPEMFLPEVLHAVAYNEQGLGNPMLCPEERIPSINAPLLRHALQEWYKPERMVIAGAGMSHGELVELTDKLFASLKPSATPQTQVRTSNGTHPNAHTPPHLLQPKSPSGRVAKSRTRAASHLFPNSLSPDTAIPKPSTSNYTGGHRFILDPSQQLNHVYIAYEGFSINDDDIFALATMQVILGGGGSFSAGGPGKGMYSRLYTHILNQYTQIDHCASFHHIYADSSLFGLFASFLPASTGVSGGVTSKQILPHLVHQLSLLLYAPIESDELRRAKNQLNSSLMMAMESRAVEVEDLGRQILVHNRKIPVTEMTAKVEKVTAEDIRRVADRVFGSDSRNKPTVVAMGHDDVGPYNDLFTRYGLSAPSD